MHPWEINLAWLPVYQDWQTHGYTRNGSLVKYWVVESLGQKR